MLPPALLGDSLGSCCTNMAFFSSPPFPLLSIDLLRDSIVTDLSSVRLPSVTTHENDTLANSLALKIKAIFDLDYFSMINRNFNSLHLLSKRARCVIIKIYLVKIYFKLAIYRQTWRHFWTKSQSHRLTQSYLPHLSQLLGRRMMVLYVQLLM